MITSYLDTAIAFVVVILGVSLIVTALTQLVSAFLGLRGSNLRWGLGMILKAGSKDLEKTAKEISTKILTDPLISDSVFSKWPKGFERWKLANGVSLKDIQSVLNSFSKTISLPGKKGKPVEEIDTSLVAAAVTNASASFDSMMARVSQRFTTHVRIYTVVFSAALAIALNLDAPLLLSRLSINADMRARLVASADLLKERGDAVLAGSTSDPANPQKAELEKRLSDLTALRDQIHKDLDAAQLHLPISKEPGRKKLTSFLGIAASLVLLSLGAPFWFNVSKTLMSLKPVLAQKPAAGGGQAAATP